MLRSFLALVAGYVTLSVLAIGTALALNRWLPGIAKFPPARPAYAALSLGCIFLWSVVAGYVAAAVARRAPLRHGLLLGALLLTLGFAFNRAEAGPGARWFPLGAAVVEAGGAVLGGYLRARRAARLTT